MSRHARRNHFSEHELESLAERAAARLIATQPTPPPTPLPPPALTREDVRAIVREELSRLEPKPGVLRRWWAGLWQRPEIQT